MKKKLFFVLILLAAFSASIFAQEEDYDIDPEFSYTPGFEIVNNRLGFYGEFSPVIGSFQELVTGNYGGGITAEAELFKYFGAGVKIGGNYNPLKTEKLSSVWNLETALSLHVRIPLFAEGIYFQPEFDYGVFIYFPTIAPGYSGKLNPCYVDQMLQIGTALRIGSPKFLGGKVELDLCPLYTFSPEQGEMNSFIGGRAGIYIKM